MIIKLILILVVLTSLMWYLAWYKTASAEKRNKSLIGLLLYGIAITLLLLVATGRIPWLFAIFSAITPWINRALIAKRLWNLFSRSNPASTKTNQTMSVEEALRILNLKPGASKEEILAAHKTLMQKMHPDKGGSDHLAKKINLAKNILLKHNKPK